MREETTAAAIHRIVSAHPELAYLSSQLDKSTDSFVFTPDFLDAYARSEIPATIRALLLRVLFADPSVFRAPIVDRFTPALAARVIACLQAIACDPLRSGTCLKHEIPKPLFRLFGLGDASFRDLCDQVLPALWAHATGGSPALPAGAYSGLVDRAARTDEVDQRDHFGAISKSIRSSAWCRLPAKSGHTFNR